MPANVADTINSFVHQYVPAKPGSTPVTLLLLHGTGGDENGMLPLGSEVARGAALISPLGQELSETMVRFCRCPAESTADVEDLKRRIDELWSFVRAASAEYGFNADRVVAMGYSNGAAMAAGMLLLRPELLQGALLFRPLVPVDLGVEPELYGMPVFVAGGTEDDITPPEQAERMAGILRAAGADVTLRWQQAGHRINLKELQAAADWVAAHWPG